MNLHNSIFQKISSNKKEKQTIKIHYKNKNFLVYIFLSNIILILIFINIYSTYIIKSRKENITFEKCYFAPDDSNLKIIHLIITRFMIGFWNLDDFPKRIYKNDYILNGIKVMKKYLFPSLENQNCKKFIWVLKIGDKANITHVKSLLNLNHSFETTIIYEKDIKDYIKTISKGFDILITTRMDYDDRIYYDAVNDVRKAVNIKKPMILYGYNKGLYYFEENNKYYEFDRNDTKKGIMSIFASLIVVLNSVNDTYNIYELGTHMKIRKKIITSYKSFGIKELNYEPAIFDSGGPKFVWVRQKYSGQFHYTKMIEKKLKLCKFNLSKFYGK